MDIDIGLLALKTIAKSYQTDVDIGSLRHELALFGPSTCSDIVRAAKQSGLKAIHFHFRNCDRLTTLPKPCLLRMRDGAYFILGGSGPDSFTLRDPLAPAPTRVPLKDIIAQWDGDVILVTRRALLEEESAEFGLGWFVSAAAKYKAPLIHVLICSLFVQIFALVTPLFFQVVVDKILVHKSESTLYVIVTGLLVVGLFDVVLQYLRSYALYHTASRVDVDLGAQMFGRLFRLPVSYFETRATGQTVARVRELETIRTFLTGQAITSIIDAFFTVLFLAVLFYYSIELGFVVVLSIPFYLAAAIIVRPILRRKIKEKFNRGAISQQYLVESVVGALTLKAAAVEPLLGKQWEEKLAAYVKTSFEAVMTGSAGQMTIQYISKVTTALTLLFGAEAVMSGKMTVGQLIAFNMISGQLVAPILRLSQLWQDVQQVKISVDRLGDIFNTTPEEHSTQRSRAPSTEIHGAISLRNIAFRYNQHGPAVLTNISLEIPAGQVIGVVGASGSGKSTLTKLIQRLYIPEHGRVLIDGIDIAQVPPFWFRRQIGVVLQENILFNRTIHENIAIATPSMSRADVIAMAQLAGAHDFIQDLPKGYETLIQERGANLSGGQRQRIAIARALARKPRILIFDEATSALDYESEQIIRHNMRKITAGRTVIIVAHRLAAVGECDRIITMSNGTIVEDGNPQDLLQIDGGFYRRLWSMQKAHAAEA